MFLARQCLLQEREIGLGGRAAPLDGGDDSFCCAKHRDGADGAHLEDNRLDLD